MKGGVTDQPGGVGIDLRGIAISTAITGQAAHSAIAECAVVPRFLLVWAIEPQLSRG